ncbi:MAG: heavy metal-responsive transcriptional regulator [Gemmatimonadaceae bacterium]|nr:heavy metal-responsive transcriptional regulator [Gemmatimonadaceae bacterium]
MRIGEVAARTEVTIETLRYYERIGLLPAASRQPSGYRSYDRDALMRIRFIRSAQDLGFTLQEIGDLLGLWSQTGRSCGAVEKRASNTLERIDSKIRDLKRMRSALARYVNACRDRHSLEECPLLAALGGEAGMKQ